MNLQTGRLCIALVLASAWAAAAITSVDVSTTVPDPSPVGTSMRWTATMPEDDAGTYWYRWRIRVIGEDFRMVRDFGPEATLDWAPGEHDGTYEIEVTARDQGTGETMATTTTYVVSPRVTDTKPVISPTANPLVFLYSAPPCDVGGRMRVGFQAPDGTVQYTDYHTCAEGLSMNFYLAGLHPEQDYTVRHSVENGPDRADGPILTMTAPKVSLDLAPYNVRQPAANPAAGDILLQSSLSQTIVATDLSGNLVWYYPGNIANLTQPARGGRFLGVMWDSAEGPERQLVREFDLAGTTVRETNAVRVSEQLQAMGKRGITSFHHEARPLEDGRILVLASTEAILTDVQGPGPVNVIGDMILVLDKDMQVSWAWDAFDHLDPRRMAVLNETCVIGGGGCPPFFATERANDWLHGNSLQLTPDGNILYSARHQDWLIKIDYQNGAGTGNVIWRLGKEGDFRFNSTEPYPWFSHQHDANFLPGDNSTLVVFDNGNTRRATDPTAHSRGQVIRLDEANRIATLVLNADLGDYSLALGSARALPNGNFHFDLGWISGPAGGPNRSRSVEVDPSGRVVFDLEAATEIYRSFRMMDLYTP